MPAKEKRGRRRSQPSDKPARTLAGWVIRQEDAPASFTATRSWRAGWAYADMDQLYARNRIQ
jgi:hypothetical protein